MGDNRDQSFDSRYFGFVDRDRIVGRATRIIFSVDSGRWYAPRTERFFEKLQ
jgi:signal peptidase I